MFAHEYGKQHFKHKTNFMYLVVFSDSLQENIKDISEPSENLYIEIEKGFLETDKWFIHFDRSLSGEYGDFYLGDNPIPAGETAQLQYEITSEIIAFIQDISKISRW